MANDHYVLMVRAQGSSGPIVQHRYPGEERVSVKDLMTGIMTSVPVCEISPYRHTLFLQGKPFQIMNIMRKH